MSENSQARVAGDKASAEASSSLSAAEMIEGNLRTISRCNPVLNAMVSVFDDEARQAAVDIDARREAGKPLGALAGAAVSVKANIDVAGHPTTHGLAAFLGSVPSSDHPLVARIKAADGVVLGHSNMPDLALRLQTTSELYGTTRNILSPDRMAGGSSGGDAVAVASGMVRIGTGNDAGGSLRVPASFAGVCAIKPTTGRLPSYASIAPDLTLASQVIPVDGFIARSIQDLIDCLKVCAGSDPLDPRALEIPLSGSGRAVNRIGIVRNAGAPSLDEGNRAALAAGEAALTAAGYETVQVQLPSLEDALAAYDGLIMTEFSQSWSALKELVGEGVRSYLEMAMTIASPLDLRGYLRMTAQRMRLQREWLQLMMTVDAVLAPVYCDQVPFINDDIASVDSHSRCARALRVCRASSLVGFPSVSLPVCSHVDGPIGLQLIGRPFAELDILDIAADLEEAAGFRPPSPQLEES